MHAYQVISRSFDRRHRLAAPVRCPSRKGGRGFRCQHRQQPAVYPAADPGLRLPTGLIWGFALFQATAGAQLVIAPDPKLYTHTLGVPYSVWGALMLVIALASVGVGILHKIRRANGSGAS